MFLQTKAHKQEISSGQKRLRLGSRVPEDAVNIAYSRAPSLTPTENVQIADTSGFILENNQFVSPEKIMYPDVTHLLADVSGGHVLDAGIFLVTNVFNRETPLYYAHRLVWPIYDSKGPDNLGFYQGKSISVIDRYDRPIDPSTYRIMLHPISEENYYTVLLYTSFLTAPSDNTRAIYTARITDAGPSTPLHRDVPGFTEVLNPQPAFQRTKSIRDILDPALQNNPIFYQMNADEYGTHKVYVTQGILTDTRTPIICHYRVSAKDASGNTVGTTPWIVTDVLNYLSALPDEKATLFLNRNQLVSTQTAAELITPYLTGIPSTYLVEGDNGQVVFSTLTDGSGYVLAYTQVDTGQMVVPDQYRVVREAKADANQGYIPKQITPAYSVQLSDAQQIKPLMPREQDNSENWYMRIQSGRFMIHTFEQQDNAMLPASYLYLLPEYFRQPFDPVYGTPYRQVENERPSIVGDRNVRLRYTPLFIDFDQVNSVVKNLIVMVNGYPARLISWNNSDGTLELDTTVRDSDDIQVTYYYEEQSYAYRGYFDPYLNHFMHLDLNPGYGHTYTRVNPLGNQDPRYAEVLDYPTFRLMDETIYLWMRPAAQMTNLVRVENEKLSIGSTGLATLANAAFIEETQTQVRISGKGIIIPYYDNSVPSTSVSWEWVTNRPGQKTSNQIRIRNYQGIGTWLINYRYQADTYQVIPGTFNKDVLYHSFDYVRAEENKNDILLGKIQVRPNSSKDSIQLIDTRTRGGGVSPDIAMSLMKDLAPDSQYYWDIGYWDGEPYQENAVIVIRLPKRILKENGGSFSKEDVNAAIEKYMAFGTFYIVDFLDEPEFIIQTPEGLRVQLVTDTTNLDQYRYQTINKPTFDVQVTTVDVKTS